MVFVRAASQQRGRGLIIYWTFEFPEVLAGLAGAGSLAPQALCELFARSSPYLLSGEVLHKAFCWYKKGTLSSSAVFKRRSAFTVS